MSAKKFRGAPFGTQKSRFDVAGIHPKSKSPGTFTQVPYDKKSVDKLSRNLGPGLYNIDVGGFNHKSVMERSKGPGWERAFETLRMAKIPHLLYKDEWEKKQLQKKLLGPGTYNIPDFIDHVGRKPCSTRGICETKAPRFGYTAKSDTPGPGTYGKGGIPNAVLEDKERLSFSNIGMLDSGKSDKRSLPEVGCHLCPGQYSSKSFTDELSERVVSKRGPYDLFTGDRNQPLSVGHLAVPIRNNLGPGQYELDSFLDKWKGEHKRHQGKFLKDERLPDKPTDRIYCCALSQCPRDPNDPGPGHYDGKEVGKPEPARRPGFGSSAERMDKHARRFFLGSMNPVGPGRYNINVFDKAQHRDGNISSFKSRTQKFDLTRDKFMMERIRPKDVRPEDNIFMVPVK